MPVFEDYWTNEELKAEIVSLRAQLRDQKSEVVKRSSEITVKAHEVQHLKEALDVSEKEVQRLLKEATIVSPPKKCPVCKCSELTFDGDDGWFCSCYGDWMSSDYPRDCQCRYQERTISNDKQ